MKNRIRLRQRIVAGVIAEGAFLAQRFARVNIAFDHKVRVGGDLKVVCLTLDEFD